MQFRRILFNYNVISIISNNRLYPVNAQCENRLHKIYSCIPPDISIVGETILNSFVQIGPFTPFFMVVINLFLNIFFACNYIAFDMQCSEGEKDKIHTL
jgi:hypothetical protein